MILTLTGFMGCGKSRIGRELSALLEWEFVDLDRYIEHKMGQRISEIFNDGEERFRAIEAEALRDVVVMHEVTGGNVVLALGGGTIMTPCARELILKRTTCVYLQAGLDTIFKHAECGARKRPLFRETYQVEELLDSRTPTYETAHFTVPVDGREASDIAKEIAATVIR